MPGFIHASPLQRIHSRFFADLEVWIKRDDMLHPVVSGNKFRKLKYSLPALSATGASTIVSMGGPWSNHLHALAYACKERGLSSIGLIRGLRKQSDPLTPTLQDCLAQGMKLQFVSLDDYRTLRDSDTYWRQILEFDPQGHSWLPEGGSSTLALRGVSELIVEVQQALGGDPNFVICACGTGATLAGIVAGLAGRGTAIGIAALANADFLNTKVNQLLEQAHYPNYTNFETVKEFDHGGFAKTTPALIEFCQEFERETMIPLEPVYTGKMMYAVAQLCRQGRFSPQQKIVLLHTGGLQGRRGFTQT